MADFLALVEDLNCWLVGSCSGWLELNSFDGSYIFQ